MSTDPGLESLYREVILDHYKNPRGHGVIEDADAEAEGQNPSSSGRTARRSTT
jgi:nitrogen fixation NifU-like protein